MQFEWQKVSEVDQSVKKIFSNKGCESPFVECHQEGNGNANHS